jgi:heptosyltransferase-2
MQRVLFIQTAFIGDAILGTAAVRALNDQGFQVDVLVRKGNEIFYKGQPNVNQVWVWDKKKKWKSWWTLLRGVRRVKYDKIYLAQRFFTMGLFSLLSGASEKIGYIQGWWSQFYNVRIPHRWGDHVHEVQRLMDLVESEKLFRPFLEVQAHHVSLPECPYITISPASVWQTKQAPLQVWQQVLYRHENKKVLLLGGPTDLAFLQECMSQLKHPNMEIKAGQYSLLQSGYVMKHAVMNFVNDSGPLHLCSATNAPVTAFFCSTVPAFGFGPLSDVSVVLETIEELPCRPCGMHGHSRCPKGHFKCGNIILPS